MLELTKETVVVSGESYLCATDCIAFGPEDAKKVESEEFPSVLTAFLLKDKENIVLDFNGATLRMCGDIQPFTLIDCKNITIKNVVVENGRSHYTEGEIVSSFPGRYRIRMNEKYPFTVRDENLIVYGEGWKNEHIDKHPMMFMQFYEKDTRKGTGYTPLVNIGKETAEYDKKHFFVHHLRAYQKKGDLVVKGGLWMRHQKKGTHVVFEHEKRKTGTVLACRCDDFTLENFRILNGSGMGVVPLCCHNVTLKKLLFFCDERSHGYVTNAADGLHTFACSGSLIMEDCIFEGMIDDALNIHGNYFVLQSISGRSVFVRCGSLAFGDKDGPISHTYYFPLRIGDTITINRGRTMDVRDKYTICDIIHRKGLDELVLDKVPVGEAGDMIEDVSAQVDISMRRCSFGKTNTHLRFQTRGKVVIEDCTTELPFWLTGDTTYWFESSPCTDFTVKNCRFIGPKALINCCPDTTPTAENPYYHRNLTVENCTFDTAFPLSASNTDNIVFSGNKNKKKHSFILAKKCGKITADNATVLRK